MEVKKTLILSNEEKSICQQMRGIVREICSEFENNCPRCPFTKICDVTDLEDVLDILVVKGGMVIEK